MTSGNVAYINANGNPYPGGRVTGLKIYMYPSGTNWPSQTVTGLNVQVRPDSGNHAAVFTGGNVGIGVTDPGQKLQVYGNIRLDGSNNEGDIFGADQIKGRNDLRLYGDGSGGPDIYIATEATNYPGPDYVDDGNVGIGLDFPYGQLHVGGNLLVNSHIAGQSYLPLGRWYTDEGYYRFHEHMRLKSNNTITAYDYMTAEAGLSVEGAGLWANAIIAAGAIRADGGFQVDGKLMVSADGYRHVAQSTTNSRYGYFEGRRADGTRGFYLGYGNGFRQVDLALYDSASRLKLTGYLDASRDVTVGENLWVEGRLYDTDNSTYYIDPNGTSKFYNLQVKGTYYIYYGSEWWRFYTNSYDDLVISNKGNSSDRVWIEAGDGDIRARGFRTHSDARLKTNIKEYVGGLETVMKMKPVTYSSKSHLDVEEIGFLAQDLQPIYPYVVEGNPDDDINIHPMGIDYGKITPLLVKAIQEQQQMINELKSEVESLKE
jgi:hypothetical protein